MAKYNVLAALPGGEPGPWGEEVEKIGTDSNNEKSKNSGDGTSVLHYIILFAHQVNAISYTKSLRVLKYSSNDLQTCIAG